MGISTTPGALWEGTDVSGASMPAGGTSGRGWLSAIWKALTDRLPASTTASGNLRVAVVEASAVQLVQRVTADYAAYPESMRTWGDAGMGDHGDRVGTGEVRAGTR